MNERAIFTAACDIADPVERAAYLDRACADNPDLRKHIEELLRDQDEMGSFLAHPVGVPNQTLPFEPIAEGPGSVIGRYKLLQLIGEGGFGTVYMAEQKEPVKRRVALKIVKLGMDTKEVIARFEAERQALALMDHPNIARVLDAGATDSGRPYFVMELVKGVTITDFCDQNQLAARDRLVLFAQVCQAVQHAHQKGIIHRDIKPSNVLVTLHDGKPVPKVIDFGVAKALNQELTEKTVFTAYGHMIGTPQYMSPEQAEMSGLDIDTRSDVYSLGVLLYELLTGTTPLEAAALRKAGFAEMQRLIREQEAPRPSLRVSTLGERLSVVARDRRCEPERLGSQLRGDLDWIVMMALDKDRTRRYETASAFAADVRRFLSEEPVEARPPSAGYRMRKFVKRNRGPVLAASVVLGAVLAGIAGTTWGWVEAVSQRDDAVQARKQEAEQRQLAFANAAKAKSNEQAALAAREEAERLAKKESAARKQADEERRMALSEKEKADLARQEAKAALKNAEEQRRKADLARQEAVDKGNEVEWRLYASRLAAAQREWETGNVPVLYDFLNLSRRDFRGWEHDYLYTLANRYQQILPVTTNSAAARLAFSADDKLLAIAGGGPSWGKQTGVQVWDLASGQKVLTIKDTWGCVAFSPDGKRLASAWFAENDQNVVDRDSCVKVWDAVSGKEILSLPGHKGTIYNVAFSLNGKLLASAARDSIKLWDIKSGNEVRTLKHHVEGYGGGGTSVAFSPDGKLLASAGKTMKVWDVASGKELMSIQQTDPNSGYPVIDVAFSPDGKRLAWCERVSGSSPAGPQLGTVRGRELANGQEVFTFNGPVGYLAFSPDGKRLASASSRGLVKVWELTGGHEVFSLKGPLGVIHSGVHTGHVAFSHDGKRLASVSSDGVRIWELAPSQDCLTLPGSKKGAQGMAFSPDGKLLAAPSSDRSVTLWDAANGQVIRTFEGHTDIVASVAFSPNGQHLASASRDKTVRLWDVSSGDAIHKFMEHTHDVKAVAFSPDRNYLASAETDFRKGSETKLRVWELASRKVVLAINDTEGALAFSPDSKLVATSYNGIVKVIAVASSKVIMTGVGHTQEVVRVAFSPDGRRLASASRDGTAKVWELGSGQVIVTLKGHKSQVPSVAFSPDGRRIATGSLDTTLKIWDAYNGHELLTLQGHSDVVTCVIFSPDGKRLASASFDSTIKIWDASKSMKELEQK